MAKIKRVTRISITVICSTCDKPSGYRGPKAEAKWEGRDWYCEEHRPEEFARIVKHCVCGHRKASHHFYSKGIKRRQCRGRVGSKYWGDIRCSCKMYNGP